MRTSPVAWAAKTEDELEKLSNVVTGIIHNHSERLKDAEAIAMCIWHALCGISKQIIKETMINDYYPEIVDLDFDHLVKNYILARFVRSLFLKLFVISLFQIVWRTL